jgi:hypothetical protein
MMRSSRQARRGPQEGAGHGEAAGRSSRQQRGGEAERRRRLGGGDVLQWPAAPLGRPCSTRGLRRGEGRSTMRTTTTGGVSSPKRGRNGGGGSNSIDGSDAPIGRCRHEDEGERGGVLVRPVKERLGEKERARRR